MEKKAWLFLTIIVLPIQREPVFKERIKQFQTNISSLSQFFTVQNAHNHVINFISDINKDKPYLMNDVKPLTSCFLVNARSIINKMDELENYVHALKPDLTMITESWAREDISDSESSINDFVIFHNDRKISVGGGCILYIRHFCNITLVEELTNVTDTEQFGTN